VHAEVQIQNTAIHHRLRLSLDLTRGQGAPVISGSHFSEMQRPWQNGSALYTTFPVLDWLYAPLADSCGLAFWGEGLYEAEARQRDGTRAVLITLLRSVDTLGPGAGLNFDVEFAKILQPYSLRFGFGFAESSARCRRMAQDGLAPVQAEGARRGLPEDLPEQLLTLDSPNIYVSSLKPAQDGSGWVVRLVNPGPRDAVARLHGPLLENVRVREVRLDETHPSREIDPAQVRVRAQSVLTLHAAR
jgi:hypothetical protein